MPQPKRRRGWISSLKDDPNSTWGNVEDFYEDISSIEAQPDGRIIVNSQVWGRIRGSGRPVPGDGFAFYHSSRAKFPPRDQFRRSPRISLVGELLEVRFSGEEIEMISVVVEPRVIPALQARPIVRNAKTKPLFERSVPPGPPYSLYPVEPEDWSRIQELTQLALKDATADEISEGEVVLNDLAEIDRQFASDVEASWSLSDTERDARLSQASPFPEPIEVFTTVFRRNPDVVVEVLKRANGICERCGQNAPFTRRSDNSPFLEVHHRVRLADGGEDTPQNATALCPNCHREVHHG